MSTGPVLRRAFASRERALHKQLAVAIEGDGHAVHQARVATRRLREALPVLGAGLPRKRDRKLRKRVGTLTHLFGAVRERDVALKMLDTHERGGLDPSGAERVRAQVHDGRNAAPQRLTASLDAHKVSRRLLDGKAFEEELAALPQEQLNAAWPVVLARRLLKRTERLRRAVNDAGMIFVPERLHTIRVALKQLRYAVELASELGRRKLDATVDELKANQDTLGELHDLDMLMVYVDGALDAEIEPHVRASLQALQAQLEADRHDLHARYLAHQPSLLVLIDRIQDQIVPRFNMARMNNGSRGRELPQNPRRQEPAERTGSSIRR